MSDPWQWVALAGLCGATAWVAVWWVVHKRKPPPGASVFDRQGARDMVFLFDGENLVDASPGALAFLGEHDGPADWVGMIDALSARFPDLPADPASLTDLGHVVSRPADTRDGSELLIENIDGLTRLRIRPKACETSPATITMTRLHQMEQELDTLRRAVAGTPYPAWQTDEAGRETWHNPAYARLYAAVHGTDPDPENRLFQTTLDEKPSGTHMRASVATGNNTAFLWYDVTLIRFDGMAMYYATDINAVVNAEIAQRNFVQTLTKTFAQLSTGLAIFDRNRQLALFNPALIDLTELPADFLSGRPNLLSFFDRLRDNRMMPEPKNYGTWRQQLAALVAAAADGSYLDTWTLPSGSTYSVSGRPHPDGAVAFLFEDITAEISLTRRFRADLEQSQAILDHLEDAIAVFSSTGVLTLTNAAFRTMWNMDPDRGFADVTIVDAIRVWQQSCQPSPFWGDLRDFVLSVENRADWSAEVHRNAGGSLTCTVNPVQNCATMIVFRTADATPGAAQRRRLEHNA